MHFGRGLRGGVIIGKNFIDFFHVSEHVDHFKAIKVFSLRKKSKITEKVWWGPPPPSPPPNFSRFFLMKVSLSIAIVWEKYKIVLWGSYLTFRVKFTSFAMQHCLPVDADINKRVILIQTGGHAEMSMFKYNTSMFHKL